MKIALLFSNDAVATRVMETVCLASDAFIVPIVHSRTCLAAVARFDLDFKLIDLRDMSGISHALSECDVLVHTGSDAPDTLLVSIETSYLAAQRAKVKRMVYVSNSFVNGINNDSAPDETHPLRSGTPYISAFVRAEKRLRQIRANGETELVILRPGIMFGPGCKWTRELAEQLLSGRAFLTNGGKGIANTTYVDNLTHAILLACAAPAELADQQAFFVCDQETVSFSDYYRAIALAVGVTFDTIEAITPDGSNNLVKALVRRIWHELPAPAKRLSRSILSRSFRPALRILDRIEARPPVQSEPLHFHTVKALQQCRYKLHCTKARDKLGYSQPVTFGEGLKRSIDWLEFAGYTTGAMEGKAARHYRAPVTLISKLKTRICLSLNRRWPQFSTLEFFSLAKVFLRSQWLGGDAVAAFVLQFSNYLGVKYGIAVNSGTTALEIAVSALGIGDGDEVIVPSYTFFSTASCVAKSGACPVFVDVKRDDISIDPEAIERAITDRTRAIVVVHWLGHSVDFAAIDRICRKFNLYLIEDSAHAVGSEWNGRKLGGLGTIGCFSFHAFKTLTAGEGGFIATNDYTLYAKARALSNLGMMPDRFQEGHVLLGGNYRMTIFQAAILSIQLKKIDRQMDRRERNARYLRNCLKSIAGITPLVVAPYATRVNYYAFGFYYDKTQFGGIEKQELVDRLIAKGVPCTGGYPHPLYDEPVFARMRAVNPDATAIDMRHENSLAVCEKGVAIDHSVLLGSQNDIANIVKKIAWVQADIKQSAMTSGDQHITCAHD